MPKIEPNPNEVPIGAKALAFLGLKKKAKDVKSELDKLQPELEEYSDSHGTPDAKGHINCVVEHAGQRVNLYRECRQSSTLIPEIIGVLKENLSKADYDRVVENVPTLRTDVLEVMISDGTIPEELASTFFITKESFAFKPKLI